MNFSQLEYFVSAVSEGSYSRAARKLYVTTQAISKSIKELENEFGISLMIRDGRGIKPTPLGLCFSDQAELILEECKNLKVNAGANRKSNSLTGDISIAVCTAECRGDIYSKRVFELLEKKNPYFHVDVVYTSNNCCYELLKEGAADMAVVLGKPLEAKGLMVRYITSLEPKFAVSFDHPLAKKGEICVTDFANSTVALPLDIRCCLSYLKHYLIAEGVETHFKSVKLSIAEHESFISNGGVVMVFGNNSSVLSGINRLILPQAKGSKLRFPVFLCARIECSPTLFDAMCMSLKQ